MNDVQTVNIVYSKQNLRKEEQYFLKNKFQKRKCDKVTDKLDSSKFFDDAVQFQRVLKNKK